MAAKVKKTGNASQMIGSTRLLSHKNKLSDSKKASRMVVSVGKLQNPTSAVFFFTPSHTDETDVSSAWKEHPPPLPLDSTNISIIGRAKSIDFFFQPFHCYCSCSYCYQLRRGGM